MKEPIEPMTIVLKNGVSITGTPDQLYDIMRRENIDTNAGMYYSESKGVHLPIADMHPSHLKNAMLKVYRVWADGLSELNGLVLIDALRTGPQTVTMIALVEAYVKLSLELTEGGV